MTQRFKVRTLVLDGNEVTSSGNSLYVNNINTLTKDCKHILGWIKYK